MKHATPSAGPSGDRIASIRATTALTDCGGLSSCSVDGLAKGVEVLALCGVAEERLCSRLAPAVEIVGLFLREAEVGRADRVCRDAHRARGDDVLHLLAVPRL